MKNLKEFFENPVIRLQIQDCLSVRNGEKTVYEIAEEIANDLCESYGHFEFMPKLLQQPILSAEQRELFLAVEMEQLFKSKRFADTLRQSIKSNRHVQIDYLPEYVSKALINQFCEKESIIFGDKLNANTIKASNSVTDIYKEQKDKVQKAIDNLQRELEKAAKMRMTITLKGCTYPQELITIESATREI